MTERKRLRRARQLVAHYKAGCSLAAAWRKVNPRSKASSDRSAADMFRREMRWIARHPDAPALPDDWWQEPKRCIGIDDRPCGKEIPRRQKRCTACAAEQIRLNRRGYNRKYHRSHKEPLNAKRNERRGRQQQRERDEAATAAKQAEAERRAKLPKEVELNGETYRYDPKTDELKIKRYPDIYDQIGTFVPLLPGHHVPLGVRQLVGDWRQRRREASQPGRAPRADRRSSKQQNFPASSGKKRKAAANGASPKRRCKTCAHPDRAAIDAELLQGVSLPTVGGRYGISSSALYRHRSRHVEAPTVGDILAPDGRGEAWREWDGAKWQRIPAPRRDHLVEVKGRPVATPWRRGWNLDNNFVFCRKVYRHRQSR